MIISQHKMICYPSHGTALYPNLTYDFAQYY